MALDIASLVAPLSDEAPSGPDLSYDDERIEIESAFERSISVDDTSDDGEGPDWSGTIRLITAQAERTRDLWLPIYLMRAAAQGKRFELLVDAAQLLAALVEERWDDLHPQLDEYGFIGRKTPCESLTRPGDFLRPLARVPLLEHPRLGRYSGEDLQRFAEQGASADGYGMFRALIDATEEGELRALLERFDLLRDSIRRVDTVMTEKAVGDTATNYAPTYEVLDGIRKSLASLLPDSGAEEAGGSAGDEDWGGGDWGDSAAPSGGPSGPAFSGSIRNRDDVIRAIDAICAYYAACEPSSPVPIVLQRAREWTKLDFMQVLEDIAPGSVEDAARVLRSNRTSGSSAAVDSWAPAEEESSDSGW